MTRSYSRTLLPDHVLLKTFDAHCRLDRETTAELLADLAEIDLRRLYAQAGYESMHAWCVSEKHMSDDAAYKRIQAARAARRHPAIFELVADGRLHLTAVVLLAPHLTGESAEALLSAAVHKSKAAILELLAAHAPKPDVPTKITPMPTSITAPVVAPIRENATRLVPEPVLPTAADVPLSMVPPASVMRPAPPAPPARVAPLSPERNALQVTLGKATHDKLRRAQDLLGHAVPSGDVAQVLDRALDALITQIEKRRLGATSQPRAPRHAAKARHIPAAVRRAVVARDGRRCTFVSERGHRCEATRRLEFDHIIPRARGGKTTPDNLRLRCRTHNRLEAERVYGAKFVSGKITISKSPAHAPDPARAPLPRRSAACAEATRPQAPA